MPLKGVSYWADRIARQIEFAWMLCTHMSALPTQPLQDAVLLVSDEWEAQHTISKETALRAEKNLEIYKNEAKSFTVDCIGHAHLDMNWMWGFDETVSIVLDTFRTMLELMKEYDDFTFSQSQASTYKIVEEYAPDMLDEIRMRIQENRWEVSASTWTEFDKNMSNGESNVRQYLYTKRYLCDLFDLSPDDLVIDFEPDTFGHHGRVPDILQETGVRYYYHCRGNDGEPIYRWLGKNGNEVLVYREPNWYLGPTVTLPQDPSAGTIKTLQMDMAKEAIALYEKYGIRRLLQVYGVGDHGGGVTRMDIEGIQDMASWTCYPTIQFSTLKNFFHALEQERSRFPIVEGEQNFIFTGCYTSQSRIKRGNHESEKMLYEAELYTTIASQKGWGDYPADRFRQGWEKVLYNQFHDILPGSCTEDSKEYALGQYQQVFATANTERTRAVRTIAQHIDTAKLITHPVKGKRAFGAGVGYHIGQYSTAPVGYVEGPERVITFFNALSVPRREVVEAVLWDWEDKDREIVCRDSKGERVPLVVTQKDEVYWQHSATKILLPVEIPPMGYSSYIISAAPDSLQSDTPDANSRVEHGYEFVLENDLVRARFSEDSMDLVSLVHKETGEELLSEPSGLRYIQEDASEGMTSWHVGRIVSTDKIRLRAVAVKKEKNELRSTLSFTLVGERSKIQVSVSLDEGATTLSWRLDANWLEIGDKMYTPQLSFVLHLVEDNTSYLYDVPFGTLERDAMPLDVPALSWAAAELGNSILQLTARGHHAFRCERRSMRLTLLRSSSDPDPYPEYGEHAIQFCLSVLERSSTRKDLICNGQARVYDIAQVTHGQHEGSLELDGSFCSIEGPVMVSAMKSSEDGDGIILRLYETEGDSGVARIVMPGCKNPVFTDFLEIEKNTRPELHVDGDQFTFAVEPYGIYTIKVEKRSESR